MLMRQRRFVLGCLGWTFVVGVGLAALDALTLRLFFVLSLAGFLGAMEVATPFEVKPVWVRRARVVLALALAVFGSLVVSELVAKV